MIDNLQPENNCGMCDKIISSEHKKILRKVNIAQTICLACMNVYANSGPMTLEKREFILEMKKVGIDLKTKGRFNALTK